MPKPENRYPNNVSGFEHIWELDMLRCEKIIQSKGHEKFENDRQNDR